MKSKLEVCKGDAGLELLITRHGQFKPPINVINLYGKVESRSTRDEIRDRWLAVLEQISKIESKNELLVLIGDLNAHLEILEPEKKSSCGGKLIEEFLDSGSYELVNASDKVIGGPYTRADPSDPNEDSKKSVLDICIISKELSKYVKSLEIDRDKKFTPHYAISSNELTFTDHYSLLLTFSNLPLLEKQPFVGRKSVRWNTNKVGGWEDYKTLTDSNHKLDEVAQSLDMNVETMMKKIDKELKRVKHIAFGKVKEKPSMKVDSELASLQRMKGEVLERNDDEAITVQKINIIDGHIASLLSKRQRESFEKELNEIRERRNGNGTCAAIFSVRDRVLGSKKKSAEAVILLDPVTGLMPDAIKQISLDYCADLLTNREPDAEFVVDVGVKRLSHEKRMDQIEGYDTELTDSQLKETYNMLSKKPGSKFSFITEGGESLRAALFKLCKTVWEFEVLPSRWGESRLVQLYKGSGSMQELSNYRFIHLKDEFQKFFWPPSPIKCKGQII